MNKIHRSAWALAAVMTLGAFAQQASAAGQQPAKASATDEQATLQKEAKISMDEAKKAALERVPQGTVESAELEREQGKLIYSFDIRTEGKSGMTEVNVDAMTGKVVAMHHEDPAKEAAEKKQGPSGATATAPAPKYHVVRHIPLGGEGGWDYLTMDSASRRLFVSRGTHVMVVDVDRGVLAGDIPKTDGVHGIALAPEMNRGFISNGRTSTMTIFDLKTLAVIQEVKTTGDRPDAILYDPFSKRVFTFNAGGKNATAFDGATGAVAGTIDLGGKPEFAASDLKGRIFVNIEDKSEISAINPSTLAVTNHWPLAPCEGPSGLAIDRAHQVLFSGCNNKMMAIVDARNGHLITTVSIGAGVDACAWDPALGLAFSSNGADGTLTVVRQSAPQSYAVADNAATQKGARTMALDESTHHIFLSTAQFGPPPAPTADRPNPRPTVLPGTFEIVEVAP